MARAYVTSTYRIPPELHEELERFAKERGLSRNESVILLLQAAMGVYEDERLLVKPDAEQALAGAFSA